MTMKINDYFSKDEIQALTKRDNGRALWMLLCNWIAIFALLLIPFIWTNPLTILLSVILLAGRQLGLAVVMHECGHRSFFTSNAANRFVGQWLAAAPIFNNLDVFFSGHREHHKLAGTHQDPDLGNYERYPVATDSFKRKVVRDLSGQTGIKFMAFVLTSAAGVFKKDKRDSAKPMAQALFAQLVFVLVLSVLMAPWVYLLWLASIMTSFMLVIRIRQVAEHAATPNLYDSDPRNNTRTVIPIWWERFVIAPNYVNYHLEHHFMAAVPCYRLKKLHQKLKSMGVYDETYIYRGYGEVIERAMGGNPGAALTT
ncbi:MAG: fatty acid desaturase family protein [Pseudomonadota bacterium]